MRVVVRGHAVAYQRKKKDKGITTTLIMITVRGENRLIWYGLYHEGFNLSRYIGI